MLVPREIVRKIGILSEDYTHSIADFDYTLKAKKAGFKAVVVPGILGYCTDDHGNNWKSANVSLRDRIKYLKSPKGLAYEEYLHFIKKHFPSHLPEAFIKLWLKTLFPALWDKFKRSES
jgi:GT2 family glycosyltransferase